MEERLTICDGKYTLIYNEETGEFRALRYGEQWRDLVGDKMVLALLTEILDGRKKATEAHDDLLAGLERKDKDLWDIDAVLKKVGFEPWKYESFSKCVEAMANELKAFRDKDAPEETLPCGHSVESLGHFGGTNPNGSCMECEDIKRNEAFRRATNV